MEVSDESESDAISRVLDDTTTTTEASSSGYAAAAGGSTSEAVSLAFVHTCTVQYCLFGGIVSFSYSMLAFIVLFNL